MRPGLCSEVGHAPSAPGPVLGTGARGREEKGQINVPARVCARVCPCVCPGTGTRQVGMAALEALANTRCFGKLLPIRVVSVNS